MRARYGQVQIALAIATVLFVVPSCYEVESQSPVATFEVHVLKSKYLSIQHGSYQFAEEKGLKFTKTERQQDFGQSQTLELENKDLLIIVSNPFSSERYEVSAYAKAEAQEPIAEQRARE